VIHEPPPATIVLVVVVILVRPAVASVMTSADAHVPRNTASKTSSI
jgi:archaellum component FlaG (FlaF/FlaG flagellin family)